MRRTNIYLADDQSAALAAAARARGVSRAELIRGLVDRWMGEAGSADLDADLDAITGSFGALRHEDDFLVRGPDSRAEHLERVGRR